MTNFSDRLRELRNNRDITQAQLASLTGISSSMIAMYESNKRNPSVENLEILSDFFNVDVDYILGRTKYTTRLLDTNQLQMLEPSNIYGNHKENLKYFSDKPELLEMYKDIYENETLQLLFDKTHDLEPEDLEAVLQHIQLIRKARGLE